MNGVVNQHFAKGSSVPLHSAQPILIILGNHAYVSK